jgi:hypothetical protein
MSILFHPHARERMEERGATETEVRTTISKGDPIPAKYGRAGFRYDFAFESHRDGDFFKMKRIAAFGAYEGRYFIVITVVVKYF